MADLNEAERAAAVIDAIRAARNSALEQAAQVCDAEEERLRGIKGTGYATSRMLARRIRKLKVDAPDVDLAELAQLTGAARQGDQ